MHTLRELDLTLSRIVLERNGAPTPYPDLDASPAVAAEGDSHHP